MMKKRQEIVVHLIALHFSVNVNYTERSVL